MDMWSNPNLTPYMVVTVHWIEVTPINTPDGPQFKLKLRTDLIDFHCVPGHHDGEHLPQAFIYITDQIGITSKVVSIIASETWYANLL